MISSSIHATSYYNKDLRNLRISSIRRMISAIGLEVPPSPVGDAVVTGAIVGAAVVDVGAGAVLSVGGIVAQGGVPLPPSQTSVGVIAVGAGAVVAVAAGAVVAVGAVAVAAVTMTVPCIKV
jgi:hypothetical protein